VHPVDEFLLDEGRDAVWETYHENSKTSRAEPHLYFGRHPSDEQVVSVMRGLREVKPYADRPSVALPRTWPEPDLPLQDALLQRVSARAFGEGKLELASLAAVLRCAQGVTRDNADAAFPRPFRAAPSGGALFPLEIYVWTRNVQDLPFGVVHYDPVAHEVDVLRGVPAARLLDCFVQRELLDAAAAVLLISAVFFRSVFKYGDRGYRFVLLEAGHVAQNAILAAAGQRLAAVPIGGYFDREVDRVLGLDGLHESVIYGLALGRPS
jgi:SagB-type dehydrogenase family enzyme